MATLAGCASLAPLIKAPPANPDPSPSLHLELKGATGEGLRLGFGSSTLVPDLSELDLFIAKDDLDWQLYQSFSLPHPLPASLLAHEIEFLDRSADPHQPVSYLLRLRTPDGQERFSTLLVLEPWHLPDAPTGIEALPQPEGAIALTWSVKAPHTARIYRRDLLDDAPKTNLIALVDPAARGRFIDRDVVPGGVYAYRIEFMSWQGIMEVRSEPSDEIYVTLDLD